MRQVEWHEYKVNDIMVMVRDGEILTGLDLNGDGRSLSPLYTVTNVVHVDQATNESGVLSVVINEFVRLDQDYIDAIEQYAVYEFYACDQSQVGYDLREMLAIIKGQVEKPPPNDEPFISTTTTTMENVKNGETSVIGEINCSPGIALSIGDELNDQIIQRIELSEDRTIIELFDPDGDRIVTIRPLEYTAFYIKPNQEGQA